MAAGAALVLAATWLPAAEERPAASSPQAGLTAHPGQVPPQVLADFTRRVQPLVLNRCAAGACHGGPQSPEPRFIRPDARSGIDRRNTQANLHAFLSAVGGDLDSGGLARLLADGHPAAPASSRLVAAPLSPQERITLDRWLQDVRLAERRIADPNVRQAAHTAPTDPPPNRFRRLLESAADPPRFPPPEEPRGVIFPPDAPAEPATPP